MQPGSPQAQMPPGEDALIRRIQETERTMREFLPSVALSIKPAMDDIRAQQATLADQQVTLADQQVTLASQVADLASRVSVSTSIATFNTGSLPDDSVFHEYGADIPITINVPTGRIVVTVGCGEATLNCGGGSVNAEATFSISGGVVPAYGSVSSRAFLQTVSAVWTSNPLSVQRAFVVTPGTYTITGKMRAWASGTATASVQFVQPYLTVQVTG